MKVVLDTNIIVSAIMSRENACRKILRMAFTGDILPMVGMALFLEYEDVLSRDSLFDKRGCPLLIGERMDFLDDILSVAQWVDIHYLWRPNLRDPADDHIYELAFAGGVDCVVTQNIKDFRFSEFHMPEIRIVHPFDFFDIQKKEKGAVSWQH